MTEKKSRKPGRPKSPEIPDLSDLPEFRNSGVSIRVTATTYQALSAAAKLARRSRSRLISDIVEDWLRQKGFME